MSKDLYNILESHNIIVNLSNNKNLEGYLSTDIFYKLFEKKITKILRKL